MSNTRKAARRRPRPVVDVIAGRLVPQRDPILRAVAAPADPEARETAAVAVRLAGSLAQVKGRAVAVAAPQIGVGLRVVVFGMDTGLDDPRRVYLNPTVEALDGPWLDGVEGCLSLPGRWYDVRRPARVRITATVLGRDEYEECTWETGGLAARAWAHEVDHLDGRMIDVHGVPARMRDGRSYVI